MNGNQESQKPMDANLKIAFLVALFGAIGGFLSWVYAAVLGQPFSQSWWVAALASTSLGMGAAFLGVFLIANTDTKALLRCLAFAMLCGFSWKPVYDAAGAFINQEINTKQERETMKLFALAKISAAELSKARPEQIPEIAFKASEANLAALRAASKVENSEIRRNALVQSTEIMKSIDSTIEANPGVNDAAIKQLLREQKAAVDNLAPDFKGAIFQKDTEIEPR